MNGRDRIIDATPHHTGCVFYDGLMDVSRSVGPLVLTHLADSCVRQCDRQTDGQTVCSVGAIINVHMYTTISINQSCLFVNTDTIQ